MTVALALVLLCGAIAPTVTAAPAATTPVDAESVGELTVTTAPAALSASAAADATTQATAAEDRVASSDVVVLRLDASGTVDANGDGTVLGDELLLNLRQTDDSTDSSEDPKILNLAASEGATAVTTTENAVYVAVDLANATFDRASGQTTAAAGDAFEATLTLTSAATDGAEFTRTTTFSAVEPVVRFEDDPSTAPAGQVVEFDVTTTLASGTSLQFELLEAGSDLGTTAQATVGADGTATVPLSFFTFEAGQKYTISVSAAGASELNETWSGEVVEPATGTEETTATSTNATESENQSASTTADSTDSTSTDAPGFGAGIAVLALAGAALLAGRQN